MCVGAASAKQRLDVVIRDAINAGEIPGPRYLANGKEIASTGGALVAGISNFVDGVDEMRKTVRMLIGVGVDLIKLIMSGEEITGTQRAEDTYFTDAEIAVAVQEAHNRGVRVVSHARSAESVEDVPAQRRGHHLPRQLHRRRGHGHARGAEGSDLRCAWSQLDHRDT